MASAMTDEQRKRLEKVAASAEPLDEDDPYLNEFDGDYDPEMEKRAWATIAKLTLEGKL